MSILLPFSPDEIKRVHIIGIGGIGMSSIAHIMCGYGFTVQGSDVNQNANTKRLEDMGIKIFQGHDMSHIDDVDLVIISSAVSADNSEVKSANIRSIPVISRAAILAELMRCKYGISVSGTHGKTTTSSMIAFLLSQGKVDPTVITGGIVNAYGSNARIGASDWIVVEADESDGTFLSLPFTFCVVTNIDEEHLNYYGDFNTLKASFRNYVANTPFYGAAILCIDDAESSLLQEYCVEGEVITYGLDEMACVRAININIDKGVTYFDVQICRHPKAADQIIEGFSLNIPGLHNVRNSLAAISVGLYFSLSSEILVNALSDFSGVQRRFTHVADYQGALIYDDYAHHPVAIQASLQTARSLASGHVIAVIELHRYSRVRDLFSDLVSCVRDADKVFVMPVYSAGEVPISGFEAIDFVKALLKTKFDESDVVLVTDAIGLTKQIRSIVTSGDVVMFLGAGRVSSWAYQLANNLLNRVH